MDGRPASKRPRAAFVLFSAAVALGACDRARCAALDDAFAGGDDARFVTEVRSGQAPRCVDGEGWSLLHRAAQAGRVEAIGALLGAGADLRAPGLHGRTALYEAAKHGHVDAVRLLLDRGADPNVREGSSGFTPLHIAAERHHLDVIRLLLGRGAEVNALNAVSQTPLWQAAWQPSHGDDVVARRLLAAGAATEVHDAVGVTPLMMAARNDHRPFVRALLDADANPNATDDQAYTAMDWALARGHGEVVAMLRARGGRRGVR